MLKTKSIFVSLLMLACVSACTTEQGYSTGQAWQRNQCNKLPDMADVNRCLSSTDVAYDAYRKEREPQRK